MSTVVYHISDIHIKYNMKDDIRGDIIYAIDQLIECISKEAQPITVVITGDIYDTANRINPEELLTFHLIFNKLNMCDNVDHIITIPGNHDYLVNPENNIIFASLVASKYSKLHHYNTNSELTLRDVHYHIIAQPCNFTPIPVPDGCKTHVLLLHETIRGAVINGSYSYSGEGKSAADFTTYHAVMLGDIHKQQSIDRSTIAYAGSLIQRNFGEDIEHGALRWVLCGSDTAYEFLKFKQRRAYITFRSSYNKVISQPTNKELYDKVKKIRFIYDNCSPAYVEKATQTIRNKYGRLDYILDDTPTFSHTLSETLDISDISGISGNAEFKLRGLDTNRIITEYLNKTYPNNPTKAEIAAQQPSKNEILRDKILKLHSEFTQTSVSSGKYKLISLAWDNVFCYGSGNFIDFTKLNGIVSIIGKNGVGKSSIIGILFYVLYDEKFGCNEILNTSQESYKITCIFNALGDTYKVVKSNSGRGGSTTLDIYKNNKLLKYGSIPEKNKALREILGNYTNLSRNNIARQVHEMYLDKSQNSFYEELVNYLDLGEYVQIPNKIKEIVKPIKASIASLDTKIKNNTKDSEQLEAMLPQEEAKLEELKTKLELVTTAQSEINSKHIRSVYESGHICNGCMDVTIDEIDSLQNSISGIYRGEYLPTEMTVDECKGKIATIVEDIQKYTNSVQKLNEMLLHYKNSTTIFNVGDVKNKYSKDIVTAREAELYNYLPSQISECRTKLTAIRKELKEKIDASRILQAKIKPDVVRLTDIPESDLQSRASALETNDKYKFSGKCECCVYNMSIVGQDSKTIKKIYNDMVYFTNLHISEQIGSIGVQDLRKEYDRLTDIITLYDSKEYYDYEQVNLRINKIKGDISSHESNILELNVTLDVYKKNLVYAQNAETIKAQKHLADKIRCYNNQVSVQVKAVNTQFTKLVADIRAQENVITKLVNDIALVKKYESYREQRYELESQLTVYQEYEKFVNIKTGIPAIIVRHYVPVLERNINEILDKIVDFRITIDPETHKITNSANGVLAVQFSGSQKFITDIIIRLCLINNHPSAPNFMIIDEGFGSLDSESLIDMCGFMEKISSYVNLDFMIIISHIEDLNQIAKTRLVIDHNSDTGNSTLMYT